MTTFDPDFTGEDFEAALAWQEEQERLCSGCGLPRDETFGDIAPNRFTATPLVCHACQARERIARQYADTHKNDHGGVYFAVKDQAKKRAVNGHNG